MTQKNEGGPAFPPFHDPANHESGMSLRDYFAGQALAGLAARPNPDSLGAPAYVSAAYILADAMIEARETSQ